MIPEYPESAIISTKYYKTVSNKFIDAELTILSESANFYDHNKFLVNGLRFEDIKECEIEPLDKFPVNAKDTPA
jgi:hypothetical protein